MTFSDVVRRLQKAPFNRSLAEIKEMTVPMVRNLLKPGPEDGGQSGPEALEAMMRSMGGR